MISAKCVIPLLVVTVLAVWGPAQGLPRGLQRVYTPEEVADPSRLLLVVVGQVFDVSAGEKFYGREGPYRIFARRDASRIFGTADLSTSDFRDVDSIDGLTLDELQSVHGYLKLYKEKYIYLGVMEGRYFDMDGKPTSKYFEFEQKVLELEARSKLQDQSVAGS